MLRISIIGICGRRDDGSSAGAGKDSFANTLMATYPTQFAQYAFADPLRDIAMTMGYTREQLTDRTLKGSYVHPVWKMTPRHFLQYLGTDVMRAKFGMDVLIKLAKVAKERNLRPSLLITDVRLPEEAAFIRTVGVMLEVYRPGGDPVPAHATERPVPADLIDISISNTGSLEDLAFDARMLFDRIRELKKAG